jgi:hypothetical protein
MRIDFDQTRDLGKPVLLRGYSGGYPKIKGFLGGHLGLCIDMFCIWLLYSENPVTTRTSPRHSVRNVPGFPYLGWNPVFPQVPGLILITTKGQWDIIKQYI